MITVIVASGFTWLLLPDWRIAVSSSEPLEQFANPAAQPNPSGVRHLVGTVEIKQSWSEKWDDFMASNFWKVFLAENLATAFTLVAIALFCERLLRK